MGEGARMFHISVIRKVQGGEFSLCNFEGPLTLDILQIIYLSIRYSQGSLIGLNPLFNASNPASFSTRLALG